MQSFEFISTKKIVNQAGGLAQIARYCLDLGISRLGIITDKGICDSGLVDMLLKALSASDELAYVEVFKDVEADPSETVIEKGLAFCREHKIDGVIGFGGGSAMDSAKVLSVLSTGKQSLASCYGIEQIQCSRLPLICVPTTAGTGSEVTPIAIITTGETTKAGIVSEKLIPDIALLDAELTISLPPNVSAATGIDAMVHAIEAYTSKHKKNLYSDILAKQAIALLSQNIETATFNGSDLGARQNMLLGACLAGQAFANAPVAAVHALAYPLGGHFHIPHGLSNALVLPHVLRFNQDVAFEHYAQLTPYLIKGIETGQKPQVLSQLFIEHLETLTEHLKLPTQLHTLGIESHHLPMLAKDAMLQIRLLQNNPKTLALHDALSIYEAAF